MTIQEFIKEIERRNIPTDSHLEIEMYNSDDDLRLYPDGTIYYDEYDKTVILTVN